MVRIVATSDLHGALPDIPECDLLLIGGDICPEGSPIGQAHWLDHDFRNWLNEVPAKEIVGIAGNHDFIFEKGDQLIPKGLNWHYLKDSSINLFGFKIYGTPWQLPFWGAFNLKEEQLAEKYRDIPKDVDILISHAPPFQIFDGVPLHFSTEGQQEVQGLLHHTGSPSLRAKVFEIKPKLLICGHIHDAFGRCTIDDIIFANVSLLNDDMEVTNQPILFDINP